MIVSKRSKLNKLEREKPLLPLIDEICSVDQSLLARKLQDNMRWEKPTGDLFVWIRVLNLFDDIFAKQIAKYGLDQDLRKLREIASEDCELLVACLQFTAMLLDHCKNRSIYSSSERIYQLLESATVDVKLAAFEVAVFLGERFVLSSQSKRFAVPKAVRTKALDVAKAFPPPIPSSFLQKKSQSEASNDSQKDEKDDQYSLVDTLDHKKKYPSKWKAILFQYYKASKAEPKSKDKKKDASSQSEGLLTFHLNEEQVRKMTLEQIYDKANEVLPQETLLSFSLSAMNAKAFNTRLYESLRLRAKLLRIKCCAIAFVSSVCSTEYTSSLLFEADPYTLSFLVDVISPEYSHLVTNDIFYAAVKALESISMRRFWNTELIRHLGANVSHGMIYQLLRHINKKIRNEDDNCYEKGYLSFFTLLGNFVDSKQLTPRLASGGMLNELMSFLNVHTKFRWTCSAAVNTIAIFLTTSPELISEFANNNGFLMLIDTINYEVQFALDNPGFGGGPPKDVIVYYTITLRQANYTRNLLKLVSHLVQSEAGDRLRNLFDSSILTSFNKIIMNPSKFGPFVLASTLDAVLYIIHNEPTAFSILREANVIETILSNYENLFMPSPELLMSLLEVLGAISLNKEGLKSVTESNAIGVYFKSFYNVDYAQELMRADMSTNIGCSMDELGRHYPSLRPVIMFELKKLIQEFPSFANQHIRPIHFYVSEEHGNFYKSADEEVLMNEVGQDEIDDWEGNKGSNLVDNVFSFMSGLLQDSGQWGKDCIREIDFHSFQNFVTLQNATFDYLATDGMMNFMSILKYLDDEDRNYGFPKILESLDKLLQSETALAFINDTLSTSYFTRLDDNITSANEKLKEFNVLANLLFTITEIYLTPNIMFNERYLAFINYFEGNEDFVDRLVRLFGRSTTEEIFIRFKLPDSIIAGTAAVLDIPPNNCPIQVLPLHSKLDKDNVPKTAKFNNTLQLRFLMYRFQLNSAFILNCISRSCMQRRQDYFTDEWRRIAVVSTKRLATGLQGLLEFGKKLAPEEADNYELLVIDTIKFISTSKDKGREVYSTSLILYFFYTTNIAEDIVDHSIRTFNELLKVPYKELSEFKDTESVKNSPVSVKLSLLKTCLNFLALFLTHGFVTKLPFTFLFYDKEYCEHDPAIVEGITSQAACQIMNLIVNTLGSKSKLLPSGDFSIFELFPSVIAEKLVFLVRQVWALDPVSDFYPLNHMAMTPPLNQIQYLTEYLGVKKQAALRYLKSAKSISKMTEMDLDDFEDDPEWPECLAKLASVDDLPQFKHEPVHTDAREQLLAIKRGEGDQLFSSTILKLCSFTKDVDKSIAQTLKDRGLNKTVYDTLLAEIKSLSGSDVEKKISRLRRLISLLEVLLCHDPFVSPSKIHDEKQAAFDSFLNFFVEELSMKPELADTDYFMAGLSLIEPILSQTPPSLLEDVKPYFPNLNVTEELKTTILEAISKFDPKENIKAAIGICRFLYLFAKDDKYKVQVATSSVLETITLKVSVYTKSKDHHGYMMLQNILILVNRACFENKSLVDTIMTAEIVHQMTKHSGKKKELTRLLDETKNLVSRDPNQYIETASKLLRLHNFNGKSGDVVFLVDQSTKNKQNEDVDMKDANYTLEIFPTGLVHLLLSQLMSLSKTDWATLPILEDKNESSNKKKKDLSMEIHFKSPIFGHICVLLKALTELLGSYKEAKLEFITFSKKNIVEDKNKPRSTSLNFFIHQLIPSQLFVDSSPSEYDRRETVSSLSKIALLALVSTPVLPSDEEPDPKKEDADMAIVRKFLVGIISKILKTTLSTVTKTVTSYSKLHDLFDLCGCLLSNKFKEVGYPLLSKNATKVDQFYFASAFIDNQLPCQISSVIAELDLNFPQVQRVIKEGLKPLASLAKIKLAFADIFESNSPTEKDEDDMDDVDDKEEIPDLFRNSTLGMYDVDLDTEDEENYYDEEGPLHEMLSGSDLSENESENSGLSGDSEIDSDLEDDEMEEDIERHLEGYDSEDSANDIEIIDELEIHSGNESESESDEELSDFYGFDDEEVSDDELLDEEEEMEDDEEEYNDAELDEWLEAFADEEEGSRDDRLSRLHDRYADGQDDVSQMDYLSENESVPTEDESNFEVDMDDEVIGEDPNSRTTREFVTSFFDVFRTLPVSGSLLADLAQLRGNGNNRPSFQIVNPRSGGSFLPRFDNAFQVILNNRNGFSMKNSFDNMYMRSTSERWEEAFSIFYQSFQSKFLEAVGTKIIENISGDSYQIYLKKVEEKERINKERQEKARKRKEELKRKRDEEATQRELEQENNPAPQREPVMLWIGDREVDISGTDIDPEFFEALPEDMRQEVFTQHVRERRANASINDSEIREIDPDFLEALPDSIRDEILQLESMTRRFSSNSEFRYGDFFDEDREEEEDDYDEEGYMLDASMEHPAETPIEPEANKTKKKVFGSPLIDRAGVSGLVRLLFAPRAVNQRSQIYLTLLQLCNNRATRTDVMGLLIAILYDGLHSQKSLEKMFGQVSARALNVKPQQIDVNNTFPVGATPVIIGVQIIEAVYYLLEKNSALRFYFLTDHENAFIMKKNQRKNKLKAQSSLEERYPINLLLNLLNNPLLNLEHFFVDLLANVLHFATRPLLLLRDTTKQHPTSFDTNFIPDMNMRLMVRILTSNECANTTFRRTISAMQHLSLLENAQKVLSDELSGRATELGDKIIKDLKSLTARLDDIIDLSDNNKEISKFTAASSDQSKLLRILTALDYMFESRNKQIAENLKDIDELRGLYKHLKLGMLWDALSDCLRVLEENSNLLTVATALLPLIEALMVVCKHSRVKELKIKDVMKYEAKKIDFTKEPIESLFFSFTDEHKKILNLMVRSNPNLMSGPFSMLVRNPKVLEFDNKKNYFDRQLHEQNISNNKLTINVRRDQVFLDSYRSLFFKSVEEFRNSRLEVNFKGEAGIDAGGVTREWYQVLSRQMFNPDYALFTAVASDETTFHPNRTSYINPEHLSFFKFIGRIIGKAIFDDCFLDCHFSRAVYKKILDRPVSLKDMENLDLEYFKSLMWMLENDITDIITEDFSVETDDYGEHKIIDLVPDGRNIPVTEANKQEYVRLVVEYRLQTSVIEQMNNFIAGFHEIIPRDLIAIFDEQELELLISGLPDIDVNDWQNNTTYVNYSPSSEQIQWFWRAVKSFDNEERAKLLQFATGTSKVPLNGFKELRGANGGCKFSIHRDYGSTERLPSSHTCFNQVDLPAYDSYETLRGSLLLAITEGHEGFGLA